MGDRHPTPSQGFAPEPPAAEARPLRVCLCPGTIGGGGIGTVMLALAEGMRAQGVAVDLVLAGALPPELEAGRDLPPGVRLVRLSGRARGGLWPLVRHLRQTRPDLLISARDHVNLLALAAHRLAGLGRSCRLVWTFHTHRGAQLADMRRTERLADALALRLIRAPDARVAVSEGVAADLAQAAGLPRDAVQVIDNPGWSAARARAATADCPHPWLAGRAPGQRDPAAPMVLGIGRLVPQKDFATLIAAFARLRQQLPQARLLILGEGPDRGALAARIAAAGLDRGPDRSRGTVPDAVSGGPRPDQGEPDNPGQGGTGPDRAAQEGAGLRMAGSEVPGQQVELAGHVANPLAYLARADLFVLSSRWEGQPMALIEALGCGCPVVATDCPTGPAEILRGGLGPLVAPGDIEGLARAMAGVLAAPPDPAALRARAADYGAEAATRAYLGLAR